MRDASPESTRADYITLYKKSNTQCKRDTPLTCLLKFRLERAMGIEPTSQAWEARILPMNYARPYFSF